MPARVVSLSLVALLVGAGAATAIVPQFAHSDGGTSTYCSRLNSSQVALSEIFGTGEPTALVDNLGLFESLAQNAPADISASWTALNTAIAALKSAIADSGHKPGDFVGGRFPAGLSAAQRDAIRAAADTLSAPATVTASSAILTEVRDVCHINLGM